ncbi:hypothetical protein [uncultured Caulobacter sp.]|uniref:hypothetical protein n=1 Tax=uncultured Caulobacter sp. TaxID=158749 RepID=UPI0026226E4A|nr:hypothetical protein [uncultured Caulobacter sp.]
METLRSLAAVAGASTGAGAGAGASSGIGYELAELCVRHGYDLVIAADRLLAQKEQVLHGLGAQVEAV